MLLLATDTSGKHGSIALAECGPGQACKVLEVVPLAGGTFSAQLVPQIAALLDKHGFSKEDLGGFAVASGPGSFTGLRVGLAAIKALADVLRKPIAAVSLLEAVAASGRSEGKVIAVIDAGRNEVFLGEYQVTNGDPHMIREWLAGWEEVAKTGKDAVIVTPDANIAEQAGANGLRVEIVDRPRSDAIARIGWKKISAGQTVSPEELEANYIRRSDAEIFAKGF